MENNYRPFSHVHQATCCHNLTKPGSPGEAHHLSSAARCSAKPAHWLFSLGARLSSGPRQSPRPMAWDPPRALAAGQVETITPLLQLGAGSGGSSAGSAAGPCPGPVSILRWQLALQDLGDAFKPALSELIRESLTGRRTADLSLSDSGRPHRRPSSVSPWRATCAQRLAPPASGHLRTSAGPLLPAHVWELGWDQPSPGRCCPEAKHTSAAVRLALLVTTDAPAMPEGLPARVLVLLRLP